MKRMLTILFALVLVVGCGEKKAEEGKKAEEKKEQKAEEKKEEKAEEGSGLAADEEFALDGIKEDLVQVKAFLKEGKPDETTYKCAAAKGYAETLQGVDNPKVKAALAEVNRICGFDAPFATAMAAAATIEAALEKDPETKFPSECAPLSTSLDDIAEAHKGKDEVKALVKLQKKVCE